MNLHASKKLDAFAVLGALLLILLPWGVACGEKTTSFSITSASALSVSGLSLSLSLNSTSFHSGQEVKIVIDERNTLSEANNVPAAQNWPMQGLTVSPNGTLHYPMGIAIFQGYYTSADISSGIPLQLYDPGKLYFGTMTLAGINAYVFQPSSDIADIFQRNNADPALPETQMNAEITATGYWSGNPKALTNFTPGVYTVFGGDEWGTSVILHFVVSN